METHRGPEGDMYRFYGIAPAVRDRLLAAFPPTNGMTAVCDHVTRVMDPNLDKRAVLGGEAELVVVGRFSDGVNDVLSVEVDGSAVRPDGRFYHVTHALDLSRGGQARKSNDLLARIVEERGDVSALSNLDRAIPIGRAMLAESETQTTPKKEKPPRPQAKAPEPETVEDLGGGLRRETFRLKRGTREMFVAEDGGVVGVRILDEVTGSVVTDRGVYGGAETVDGAIAAWRSAAASVPGL